MPYVPPHLRVSHNGKFIPTPVAPPSPMGRSQVHDRSNRELLADVNIQRSADFIRRCMILNCHHVEFAKFEGESFAHLRRQQLYTLKAASTEDDASISGLTDGLSLQERQHPARFITEALQKDLRKLLEKFEGYARAESAGRIVPLMKLRLGRLLCYSRSALFEWQKIFTPKEVETRLERGDLSWTFDNGLSEAEFTFVHELAHRSASQTWLKERFIVQVSDEMKPDALVLCVCSQLEHKEHSDHLPKSPAEFNLNLKKVKMNPVRHMISDIACVSKNHDVRVAFYIKEYVTGLTEDELCDLKSCISKASVDDTVKGGLRWPLGSKQSTSGRFKVVGTVHDRETIVIGGGLKWSLLKRNRVEFKASSGRISYEVAVRPLIYHEFCKGRTEQTTVEELMLSFEDLLQYVWADCIS